MKMIIIYLNSILCLVLFAHVAETRVYVLHDYHDAPVYIKYEDRGTSETESSKHKEFPSSSSFKPKRTRSSKQAILHYGRHIYHLDSFKDLAKLRSDPISYDYFDHKDLLRTYGQIDDSAIPWYYKDRPPSKLPQYFEDLAKGKKKCKKKGKCNKSRRKYNDVLNKAEHIKRSDSGEDDWKKNMQPSDSKRFRIIYNRNKHKHEKLKKREPREDMEYSEENHEKRKSKSKHNKKKKYSSKYDSFSNETKEKSDSNSESRERWKKNKKKIYDSDETATRKPKKKIFDLDSNSSEEKSSEEITTRQPKKKYDSNLESDSLESDINSYSNSVEEPKRKKRKKKKYDSSEETKLFDKDGEIFLQGNKLYSVTHNRDERRRLPQFLPKRYHWDPSEMSELGYYWFNGPRGKYAAPAKS